MPGQDMIEKELQGPAVLLLAVFCNAFPNGLLSLGKYIKSNEMKCIERRAKNI